MARYPTSFSLVVLVGLGAAGCAAPIKALMQNSPAEPPTPAATIAPPKADADRDMLRLALEKRAAALRQELAAKPNAFPSATAKPQRLPDERLDTRRLTATMPTSLQSSTRVIEMLERTKATQGGTARQPAPKRPSGALALTNLSTAFQVKNEARLSSLSNAVPAGNAEQALVRFEGKATSLDASGNGTLAALLRKNEDTIGYRVVIIGGLSGPGQAWEKMQLAASRIETIANHVPPPVKSERRFDAGLDVGKVRLEIAKDGR